MVSRLSKAHIIKLFAIMFAVKALVAFAIFPLISHALGSGYLSDSFPDRYDLLAENLAAGNGYRVYPDTSLTMLRAPGFVILLAGLFYLFGKGLLAIQIVQYFMSAGTAIFVYLIAMRLIASPLVSIVAAAIFLFFPMVLMSDSRGGVDTTLMLCMAAAIWQLYRAIDHNRISDYILLGLIFGYTMLVKPSVALILPAVGLFLMLAPTIRHGSIFLLIRNFAITGLVATVIMTPWIIRNYEISGKFLPTMTVGGLALYQGVEVIKNAGNGEEHYQLLEDAAEKQIRIARSMGLRVREDFFPQFYSVQDEVKFYNELGRRAFDNYMAEPTLLVRAIAHNSWAFWLQGRTETATILDMILMIPFLVLSAFGATLIIRRDKSAWILIITIIAFMLPHLVIIAISRHSSTIIPLMAVLSSGSLLAATRVSAGLTHIAASSGPSGR
jgi:4-amino-4-deoxy-L-arabinose transferase-like glycosyltransferase